MTLLSDVAIAQYAANAGLVKGGQALPKAVAIALAETGGTGNTKARSHADARGLWQIHAPSHPDWAKKDLYNPAINAEAMFEISGHGSKWSDWTTYKTGAYLLYMPRALAAVKDPSVTGVPDAAVDVTPFIPDVEDVLGWKDALVAIGKAVAQAARWVANRHNWVRVLEVGVGLVAIAGGAAIVNDDVRAGLTKAAEVAAVL